MNSKQIRPDRCLVTGATGFVGTALCAYFDEQRQQQYVPLVRQARQATSLRARWPQLAVGDLLDPRHVRQALEGCDAIIHLAHGGNGPQATRNLLQCARDSGARRFIHISTMSVHGPRPGPEATREETATIGRYDHDYSDSKAEQEEMVQQAHAKGELEATILRPTIVYGPGSHFVLQVAEEARTGVVSMFDHGSGICNAVYIDDLCRAIDAALTSEKAVGEAMFINGEESISWGEFIQAFASLGAPHAELINLSSLEAIRYWAEQRPAPSKTVLGRIVAKLKRSLASPPPPPSFPPLGRVERETFPIFFSNDKAKQLLDWSPQVDFSTGTAMTRAWFDSKGKPA
ncbi:NAD-dependent epimerase/dehydratase family protein [Massilia yuzhufengensis]|nr:NAD(P)-dependent oxidoreductase [Massilia yuzhufengensis]